MKKILIAVVALAIVAAIAAFLLLRDEGSGTPVTATEGEETQEAIVVEADDSAAAIDGAVEEAGDALASAADDLAGQAEAVVAAVEEAVEETAGTSGEDNTGQAAEAEDALRPSFDVVRVEANGDAVLAGRAAPGARVNILTRDGVLAQAQADGNGEWVVVLDTPMAPGSHEIWLEAEGSDGIVSESREAVVVTIPGGDGVLAEAEAGEGTGEDTAEGAQAAIEGGGVLAVTVPREDSEGAVTVLQAPAGGVGIAGGGALTLDSLSYDEAGAVTLSGKAEPGAQVRPYVDGELAGSALADAEGNWSMTLDRTLDAGRHDLRVDQVDGEGVVVARLETPIQQAAFTMPSSAEPLVVIQPGNNLWLIARHVYGKGVLYTQIFEANRDQIGDPDLIYPGQIFVLPEAGQTGG
ncbi:MAG: Ig-like domain-containing protein [Proteobacteria bacterium]|nr:Ig-like domain-containing protein [Pseudomonadota bacterium]